MNDETLELLGTFFQLKGLIRQKKLEKKQYLEQLEFLKEHEPSNKKRINELNLKIKQVNIDLKNYTNRLRSLTRTLDELKRTLDNSRYDAFYLHYVKGYSLQKTADKVGYSKSGVTKICKSIKSKIVYRK